MRRFGAVAVVRFGSVVAAAGFAVVAVAPGAWVGMLGFTLLGLGLCVIVPQTFAAAGRLFPGASDTAVARLNVFNYVGFLVGSPLVGALGDAWSYRGAMLVPMVLVLATLLYARSFGPRTATDTVSGMSGRAQLMWDERGNRLRLRARAPDGPGAAGADQGAGRGVRADRRRRGCRWLGPARPGTRRCGWCTGRTTWTRCGGSSADPLGADGSYGLGTEDNPAFAGMHEASALIAGQSVGGGGGGVARARWRTR